MPGRALVLGAGGARGFAHMGILYALERHGLRPDMVIGCSIGALIGALYALRGSFAEAERVLRDMGRGPDPLNRDRIEGYLSEYFGNTLIEEMTLGFACVSADLTRPGATILPQLAKEVIFKSGPLWPAVRASIGTPIIFPAFPYRGMKLVDGGILDPVPAWTAREMGAERIISVEITGPRTVGRLIRRSVFAQWGYRIYKAKKRARAVSDVYIKMMLPYHSLDFSKGEEIAIAGYRAFTSAFERFVSRL